jgi:hypothetical protein
MIPETKQMQLVIGDKTVTVETGSMQILQTVLLQLDVAIQCCSFTQL